MSTSNQHDQAWNQTPVDEISMYQVMTVFFKRWRYFLILALAASLLALVKHKYFPTYPARGTLIIKDVRNSQLQSMLSQVVGSVGELGLVANDEEGDMVTASLVLNTHNFYLYLAGKLKAQYDENKSRKQSTLHKLFKKFEKLEGKKNYLEVIASYLQAITNVHSGKSGQIMMSLKTGNKALSVLLMNETLTAAKETLIERELQDLHQAEKYFQKEIEAFKKRLDRIESSTISKMQKSHILSVDVEKGESSRYMNELKKKINDTNIKITSNKRRISGLKRKARRNKSKSNDGVISKFNENAQIQQLIDENKELYHNLSAYRSTLKRYNKQKKGLLPFQHDIEKMRANYTFEYKVYESLRDSLAKIGLQKTYVRNKVEVLEKERSGRVKSSPGVLLMILIAIFASQIIGLGSIYLFELFRPENDISGTFS